MILVRHDKFSAYFPPTSGRFLLKQKVTVKWSKIMKKLTTLFLATIFTTGLFAQNLSGKLSGTVTSDGQPLVGANVVLQGTSSGAATGEDGTYYIFDVQPGIYTVQVNYIGYQTQIVSNVRVTIGLTTIQDFELAVAAVEGKLLRLQQRSP